MPIDTVLLATAYHGVDMALLHWPKVLTAVFSLRFVTT